ncbi:hypothetical protein METBIDRAFT_71879 [Metschnikowia bicuspidata var. bicuspidata NRRL YB-4993]|uniref:SAM domain-containing protein n=1 Tax=Metschnikowia bicuspidata var. bicuspidata NRRL YB-4993 TaxID=869754 RepID=A0A1A0H9Y3_9ASCO|nr:hypothetical protein METBIDRAFT_71879 [Metschnikowia bicuspidata var. bicuspidata NRRL YB-4993]OBA20687.1 hypothetical protein METBIDRAFT_71879 [Metschnikowia bicuspidata var. bicuspidata NRRL YB-4993]
MDAGADYMGEKFSARLIIFSPLPVETQAANVAFSGSTGMPENYHVQRNQSVGYNLQQEFEALKADLDLDLSYSNETEAAPETSSAHEAVSEPPSAHASLALSNGNSASAHNPLQEPLMRDPSGGPAHGGPGLQALLMSKNAGFASLLGTLPSRPQSVNDFSSILPRLLGQPFLRMQPLQPGHFYLDMLAHTSWIENLSPLEIMTMLDYWCNNLPFDILLTMKSRLHNHLSLGMQPPAVFGKPDAYSQYLADFVADMDSLSFSDAPRAQAASAAENQQASLLQPKPKANSKFHSHLFADSKVQRPKLADPSLHNRVTPGQPQTHPGQPQTHPGQPQTHHGERTRSPTSHLYEKTSFLQLAAASHLPHSYGHGQQHVPSTADEGFDQSAAHKLGALATINSRVALDFNRKVFQHAGPSRGHTAAAYEESLNRQNNSSSVPANTQKYSVAAMAAVPGAAKPGKKEPEFPVKPKLSAPSTPVSNNSSMPAEIVNQELLNNIPAWLKLLRLHKYTDYLKDMYWADLVELTDGDLEDLGVKALGARRKLLKAFEAVKLSKA